MSTNEVNLHLIPGGKSQVEIHVTMESEQSIDAYLFSTGNQLFAEVFIRWLRERTNEPMSNLHFNLTGNEERNALLSSALCKAGATVSKAG